jgi:hypothetical protein
MFNRSTVAVIALIAFGVGTLVGVLGWNAVTAGSGEASISASDAAATIAAQSRPTTQSATTVPAVAPTTAATADVTTEAQSAEATTEAAVATEAPAVASTGGTVYRIDSAQSEVRFKMQEDLRGTRTDVIGITKDVGGDITVDLQQPQNSTLNPIVINARTFVHWLQIRTSAIRPFAVVSCAQRMINMSSSPSPQPR